MNKTLKILLIVVISILVLMAIAIASIPLFFPPEKMKAMLITEMSNLTGRQVAVKKLQFNIFKGIELDGVTIKERDGENNFIKDDTILLKYNLFALLVRQLVIYKFELVSPYVEIIKDRKGIFNFQDIIDKNQKPAAGAKNVPVSKSKSRKKHQQQPTPVPQPTAQPAGNEAGNKPDFIKNIIITSAGVKNGNFSYQDFSAAAPLSLKVDSFNFDMDNIILTAVKPATVDLNCNVIYNKLAIPVLVKSSLVFDMKEKGVKLNISTAKIAGINTQGELVITDFKNAGGELVTTLNTAEVIQYLPAEMKAQLKGATANIEISNNAWFRYLADGKKLSFKNTVSIDRGEVTYNEKKILENLKGKISVTDKYDLKSNFTFLLAGSSVKLDTEGYGLNKIKSSRIYVNIYSPKFATEYLLALFPQKEKAKSGANTGGNEASITKAGSLAASAKKSRQKSAGTKQLGAMPEVHISLKADAITYKTVEAGKTTSNIKFINGKLSSDTSISAYNGTIYNSLTADINKEKYSTNVEMKNVLINKLIDDAISVLPKKDPNKKTLLDDLKSKVYGNFSTKVNFSGDTFIDVPHTIKGDGNFAVKDGKLAALDSGKDLYAKTKIEAFRNDMPFDFLGADFNMSKGVINIKNFRMYSGANGEKGDMRAKGDGYVTVDTKLDFTMLVDLNPRVAKQVEDVFAQNLGIRDISYAYSSDGWMPFDFRVYGTVENKRYDFNQKRMFDNIKKSMGKKLQNQGTQYFQDKSKDLLKNLFGK